MWRAIFSSPHPPIYQLISADQVGFAGFTQTVLYPTAAARHHIVDGIYR
ncbi:MAG: hypothetical protein F6K39_43045 [Okeania sp. SIO3B3]|nr:hypothetical protein [Okeania sp. SIO3B3]